MTIEYNQNTHQLTLVNGTARKHVSVASLNFLASVNGWGDVQTVINTAIQNPSCAIPVDNSVRPSSKPRNANVYSVLQ